MLVSQDFGLSLVAADELPLYAPVHVTTLQQRLSVPFAAKPQALVDVLQRLFADVIVNHPAAAEAGAGAAAATSAAVEKLAASAEKAAAAAGGAAATTLPELVVTVVGPHATDKNNATSAAATEQNATKLTGAAAASSGPNGASSSGSGPSDRAPTLDLSGSVRCVFHASVAPGAVVLEWDLASPAADLLADSIVAAAMHAQVWWVCMDGCALDYLRARFTLFFLSLPLVF